MELLRHLRVTAENWASGPSVLTGTDLVSKGVGLRLTGNMWCHCNKILYSLATFINQDAQFQHTCANTPGNLFSFLTRIIVSTILHIWEVVKSLLTISELGHLGSNFSVERNLMWKHKTNTKVSGKQTSKQNRKQMYCSVCVYRFSKCCIYMISFLSMDSFIIGPDNWQKNWSS